ncbi:MAG: hypothetical protein WA902_18795 [Thermosynechococcaceae cyanobacterium]
MTVVACDHDFQPSQTLVPFGIFLPQYNELFLFFVTSTLTADCIVDILQQWWDSVKERFAHIKRLVINADNGPENHSRRTQFMNRLVTLATTMKRTIELAYYPPYPSKYNAVERTFGWLEQHWSGMLLDSVETVVQVAQALSFKGNHPVVQLITETYNTGVKLTPKAMAKVETCIDRLAGLEKWFVKIPPLPSG